MTFLSLYSDITSDIMYLFRFLYLSVKLNKEKKCCYEVHYLWATHVSYFILAGGNSINVHLL